MSWYFWTGVLLLPWALYTLGAARRCFTRNKRLYMAQLLLALVLLFGSALAWIIYDPHFGLDPFGIHDWSYDAVRVESWVFRVAFVLFMLSQSPDLRHAGPLPRWRKIGKTLSVALILLGACAAWFVAGNVSLPWLRLPWSIARALFTLCVIPHAAGYLATSGPVRMKRDHESVPKSKNNGMEN